MKPLKIYSVSKTFFFLKCYVHVKDQFGPSAPCIQSVKVNEDVTIKQQSVKKES